MITTLLRPKIIKRFNIRANCDINCKERCVNLMNQQTESLNSIAKNTSTILIINIVTLMGPIIIVGATCINTLLVRNNALIKQT